ncbi:hypothetical protein ACFLU6_15125 [Acidobacteriota bacterium]
MKDSDTNKRSSFDRHLKAWGRRPPKTPPAAAARHIRGRIKEVSRPLPLWRLAAAAVLVLAFSSALWLVFKNGHPYAPVDILVSTPTPSPQAFEPPPLDDNVVLWWLDSDTPVYFVLSPPENGQGETQ